MKQTACEKSVKMTCLVIRKGQERHDPVAHVVEVERDKAVDAVVHDNLKAEILPHVVAAGLGVRRRNTTHIPILRTHRANTCWRVSDILSPFTSLIRVRDLTASDVYGSERTCRLYCVVQVSSQECISHSHFLLRFSSIHHPLPYPDYTPLQVDGSKRLCRLYGAVHVLVVVQLRASLHKVAPLPAFVDLTFLEKIANLPFLTVRERNKPHSLLP